MAEFQLVDTQKIQRCHAADTERRVLGRDVLHSGPGLGTRHRGRDVPPEVAYSCPRASRKEVPRGGSILGPCGHGAEALPDEPPSHVRKQNVLNFLYGQQVCIKPSCSASLGKVIAYKYIPYGQKEKKSMLTFFSKQLSSSS